jgi:hypothetical protein
MLLPVPAQRASFASAALGASSILSIEFLFADVDIPSRVISHKQLAMEQSQPYVAPSAKMTFAAHVETLPNSSFQNFVPIFARLDAVLSGQLI